MKTQEIKAIMDLSEKRGWDFDSDNIRYLIDNGIMAQDLVDFEYDPDLYDELETWAFQNDLLAYETKGPVIETQEEMDKLETRLNVRFGYELTADDKELIEDLDIGDDDVNWLDDYSYKFNPRTWGSIREWAADEYVGLL